MLENRIAQGSQVKTPDGRVGTVLALLKRDSKALVMCDNGDREWYLCEEVSLVTDVVPAAIVEKPREASTQSPSIEETLSERGHRYGAFSDHARVTQQIKSLLFAALKEQPPFEVSCVQREALAMIAHKLGRIVCGDPSYADSWADIAGYATLVVQDLEEGGQGS